MVIIWVFKVRLNFGLKDWSLIFRVMFSGKLSNSSSILMEFTLSPYQGNFICVSPWQNCELWIFGFIFLKRKKDFRLYASLKNKDRGWGESSSPQEKNNPRVDLGNHESVCFLATRQCSSKRDSPPLDVLVFGWTLAAEYKSSTFNHIAFSLMNLSHKSQSIT